MRAVTASQSNSFLIAPSSYNDFLESCASLTALSHYRAFPTSLLNILSYPILSLNTETSSIPSLSRSPWLIFILPPQEPWVSQVHFIREKANGCLGKNIFQVNAHWRNWQAAWRNQIYLSHCLLIPKSNSLHKLYHQFFLVFTVGLCLPISSSLLILACLGEENHPKEIPRGKSLCSYEVHKEEFVCSAYWRVETLPSYKEQECYYLITDSCFTLLQKSVLLNVWILAGFFITIL